MRKMIMKAALVPILFALIGLHSSRNRSSGDQPRRPRRGLEGRNGSADVERTREVGEEARVNPSPQPAQRHDKRGDKGRFAPDPDKPERKKPSVEEDPYQRPGLRDTTRRKIWEQAVAASPDGKVRDPDTNEVIDKDSDWQAGHKWGWEFRKHRAVAQEEEPPRSDFMDEYNFAEHYRPETKATNESHRGEAPDHVDYWKDYYATK